MPSVTYLSLISFDPLHSVFLFVPSEAMPRLTHLNLVKCKLSIKPDEMAAVPISTLEMIVLDETRLTGDLLATIRAPNLFDVTLVVDSPSAARDMALWCNATTLTIKGARLHDVIQLPTALLDALPQLMRLRLQAPIAWINQKVPVLKSVLTLVGTAAAFTLVRGCECCDAVLTALPPATELMCVHLPLIHPRILEEVVRMCTLMKFESEGVRLRRADQGRPVDVLTPEYDKQRLPWVILPALLPRDQILTKRLVIKFEHVVEEPGAAKEIVAAMQAIAAIRPHVVDGLCALLDGFERGGLQPVVNPSPRVLQHKCNLTLDHISFPRLLGAIAGILAVMGAAREAYYWLDYFGVIDWAHSKYQQLMAKICSAVFGAPNQ
ncbi:hypothetical protein GGF32_008468 [Allomyces javanicus]|nr:hypothetical protein GGF32_008468 [Allomyces javanicus]